MENVPGTTIEQRIAPRVKAALAAHIGEDKVQFLTTTEAAMRLAVMAPREYLNLHKAGQNEAHMEQVAQRYAPAPATPEEAAAQKKLQADIDLAKSDYPAFKAQRDKEAKERIERAKAQKGR
jgi:hypothetical protein